MSRGRTPRDLPAQDPIDRLEEASSRLRQVASDLYSADVDEITQKTEVHVHMTAPSTHVPPAQPRPALSSQPERESELPPLPVKRGIGGALAGLAGLVSGAIAIARALGWL